MKNVFIISGPSGAGEDSIIEGLKRILPVERIITTTTRAMRPGEKEGNPYYFTDAPSFQKKVAAQEFAEFAEEYNHNFYGVTRSELERVSKTGKIGLWKIEYKGVITAKALFPDIVAIFLNAPLDILEERIRHRDHVTDEYIAERMAYTREWLKHTDIYDYHVENEEGQLEAAIQKVASIIQKESTLSK